MITPKKPRFDISLLFSLLILLSIGLIAIYSATHTYENKYLHGLFKTQIVWIFLGLILFFVVSFIPMRAYFELSYVFYAISLLLLLYLEIIGGHTSKGAMRWISIGMFKIQPSEYAKIGLLFALSRYLSGKKVTLTKPSTLIAPISLVAVPFFMVLKQPDLGTALIIGLSSLPILFVGGMPLIQIFFLVSPIVSVILSFNVIPWGIYFITLCAILYFYRTPMFILVTTIIINISTATATAIVWNLLHDYQKSRILTFVDPMRDPYGAGYQIIQSKVAIGSGGIIGKGFLKGTQTKLSFLPEQHTDFVFSVLGEQFGLIGALVLFSLYMFMIYKGVSVLRDTKNHFLILLGVGAASILGLHVFTNLAMAMGIMPVAGIPLPFLSYGGSFLSTCMILTGLISFVRRNTHKI